MELRQGESFEELFRTFEHTAFHLEVADTYHTPEESGPFQLFLHGVQDDFAWHAPWLTLMRQVTSTGRRVERVRVVSVPHVDYTRWGLSVASLNIAAGEDIRWLPRHLTHDLALPTDDFWLFDDTRVAYSVFEPNGRWAGVALTTDPHLVQRCVAIARAVWSLAIPHSHYSTS